MHELMYTLLCTIYMRLKMRDNKYGDYWVFLLEKHFHKSQLDLTDLAQTDYLADLPVSLLEHSVQLLLLSLWVHERQYRHLVRGQ